MTSKVSELEKEKDSLQSEILTLQYVKRNLRDFEEKERRLRSYFGMEQDHSMDQVSGGGGGSMPFSPDASPLSLPGLKTGDDFSAETDSGRGMKNASPESLHMLGANLDALQHLLVSKEKIWSSTPSIFPVDTPNPRISSGFGMRKNPFTSKKEFHAGVDILGPPGTKIIAPSDGAVVRAGYDRWLGKYVVLLHGDNLKTIYGHLNHVSIREGSQVRRGQPIGVMGNTGLSTSRHLHYGVVVNNRAVDPMGYILEKGR